MAMMTWIRLETTMFENPKILNLKDDKQWRAIIAHLEAMAYTGRNALAGYIPKSAIRLLHIADADVRRLVAEGLWKPAPGGWEINGWADFQLADADAIARSDKAKKAAAARWEKRNGRAAVADG